MLVGSQWIAKLVLVVIRSFLSILSPRRFNFLHWSTLTLLVTDLGITLSQRHWIKNSSLWNCSLRSWLVLRGYIHLCWLKKSKIFLLHFLKVPISENLFPKNHTDLSSRTDLTAIDSALSAIASHLQVRLYTRLSRNLIFQKVRLRWAQFLENCLIIKAWS